jgi:hypothetical protein
VKSFNETHPDFGVASAPVDVHLYVDGRAQVLVDADLVEVVDVDLVEVANVVTEVETFVELVVVPPLPVHGRH